jgi:hypothetical protein
VRKKEQLEVVKVVDCGAFVGGDPGDGGVCIESKGEVDVLWQWGDEVASVGGTVDKHGEKVNFEARGLQRRAHVAGPDDCKCFEQAFLAVHLA